MTETATTDALRRAMRLVDVSYLQLRPAGGDERDIQSVRDKLHDASKIIELCVRNLDERSEQ